CSLPRPPFSTLFPYTTLFRSYPFEIEYGDSAIRHRISAYRKGMSPSEAQGFDSYVSDIKKIIAYGEARQKLLRSMPDGEYQFRRSEEHTSELQSREKIVCRLL